MSSARVVAIMPVYNEARHLPRVLESIAEQRFDRGRFFFIAVDGNSQDGSAQIVRDWLCSNDFPGCVISNPRRKIPIALNLGLAHVTSNDVVLRLDAHTIYDPDYVDAAVRALENAPRDVGCVGCAQIPAPGSTLSERIIEALYTNPMGLGGADFRVGNDVREVDNIYLGVWRPGVLTRAGGFNETMEANEDAELSARLRRMGYRILRVPLPCRCLIKRGLLASIRQWNRYGYWRAKMLQHNPGFIRLRHVVSPAAAVAAIALACSPMRLLLLPAFALYAALIFRYRAQGEPAAVTLACAFYFPWLQLAFAAGMLTGALTGRAQINS
jgi:glycosyltransferase involved in cell wall biosynthesis